MGVPITKRQTNVQSLIFPTYKYEEDGFNKQFFYFMALKILLLFTVLIIYKLTNLSVSSVEFCSMVSLIQDDISVAPYQTVFDLVLQSIVCFVHWIEN